MIKSFVTKLSVTVLFILSTSLSSMAWNYPENTGLSTTPTINTADLYERYTNNNAVIVDVRSRIEYETTHIEGSIHIPVGKLNFIDNLKKRVSSSSNKIIAFYCNGGNCLKAPAATEKALEAGIKNCFAYYEGIPGWAEAHPDKTILRGKSISSDNQLIPKSEFKKRTLSFEEFKKAIEDNPNALVIDVRDNIQKSGSLPGISMRVISMPIDKFILNFVNKKRELTKSLYIFDQVGKQVVSLQYDLNENDYTDYWFLSKGATKVLGKQTYKQFLRIGSS